MINGKQASIIRGEYDERAQTPWLTIIVETFISQMKRNQTIFPESLEAINLAIKQVTKLTFIKRNTWESFCQRA
jgi:hypothetical protein